MNDIVVEAPDGTTVAFPAGTDQETILRAMRQQYGGPAAITQGANGVTLTPQPGATEEDMRGAMMQQIGLQEGGRVSQPGDAPADDGRTFENNLVGHIDAGLNTLSLGLWPHLRGLVPGVTPQAVYENIDATRADSPYTTAAAEAGGAIAPIALTSGLAAPSVVGATAATRAAPRMADALVPRVAPTGVEAVGRAGTLGYGGAGLLGFNETFGRTGDIEQAADAAQSTALMGGGVGAFVPAVAGIPGAISNYVGSSGQRQANRLIDDALAETGETRQGVAAQLQRTPDTMPLDVSPSLLNRAQGIAAQPGQGQAVLTSALRRRSEAAPETIREMLTETFGEAPDAAVLLSRIQEGTRAIGAQFDALWPSARAANIQPVLDVIDNALGPGWRLSRTLTPQQQELAAIRNQIAPPNGEMVTSAANLHALQSDLRTTIDDLFGGTSGSDTRLARALRPVRQSIVDVIDEATGGAYRPIQRQYADASSVRRAFDRGYDILNNPRSGSAGVLARPEFWREWADGLSPAELEAARLGAVTRLDTEIGAARNAVRQGIAVPDVEFNRERLAVLFGADELASLFESTTNLRQMLANTNAIIHGSQTAQRQLGQQAVGVRDVGGAGMGLGTAAMGAAGVGHYIPEVGMLPAAALTAAAAGRRGADMFRRSTDLARNTAAAQALTQTGAEGAQNFASGTIPQLLPRLTPPQLPAPLALTVPAALVNQ